MQSNYIACGLCGHAVEIPDIFGGATFYSSGTRLICDVCGHATPLPNGRYDFIADAWRTLKYSELTEVDRFRSLVSSAASGRISTADAIDQAAAIHRSFGKLLATAMSWGIPSLLIAVVALYLQYKDLSDKTDEEILAALKRSNATNEQVLKELKILNAPNLQAPPRSAPRDGRPLQTQGPNRHERRKAEKQSRGHAAKNGDQ